MALLSANILICERVLVERDNVPSLIRVVDLFYISPETPKNSEGNFPPVILSVFANVSVTGEDDKEHEISLVLGRPDGSLTPIDIPNQKASPGRVEDSHRTIVVAAHIGVNPSHHGRHEFRLIFDGEVVASVWFVISRNAQPLPAPTAQN